MTDKRIILTTVGSKKEAEGLARQLCERRLAACVNIVSSVESIYHWKGKIETTKEWMLLIKTTADHFDGVRKVFDELHPYDLPECVEIQVERGSQEYLEWIAESVEQKSS